VPIKETLLYLREHMVLEPLHSVILAASNDACETQAKSVDRIRFIFHIVTVDLKLGAWGLS